MPEHQQTFVGLVALRVVFAGMSLFVAAYVVVVLTSADSDGTASEVAGAASLGVFTLVASFAGVALALERLVVDDIGVHRRNPVWKDRSTPWSQVSAVRVDTDRHNTHPVIQTIDGRTVRLRAAGSLVDSPKSTPRRAAEAISSHLDGGE